MLIKKNKHLNSTLSFNFFISFFYMLHYLFYISFTKCDASTFLSIFLFGDSTKMSVFSFSLFLYLLRIVLHYKFLSALWILLFNIQLLFCLAAINLVFFLTFFYVAFFYTTNWWKKTRIIFFWHLSSPLSFYFLLFWSP